jgi:hypothetical protein
MILVSSPWDQSRHTITAESVVIRGMAIQRSGGLDAAMQLTANLR